MRFYKVIPILLKFYTFLIKISEISQSIKVASFGCFFIKLDSTPYLRLSVWIKTLKYLFTVNITFFQVLSYFVKTLGIIFVSTLFIKFNSFIHVFFNEFTSFIYVSQCIQSSWMAVWLFYFIMIYLQCFLNILWSRKSKY